MFVVKMDLGLPIAPGTCAHADCKTCGPYVRAKSLAEKPIVLTPIDPVLVTSLSTAPPVASSSANALPLSAKWIAHDGWPPGLDYQTMIEELGVERAME